MPGIRRPNQQPFSAIPTGLASQLFYITLKSSFFILHPRKSLTRWGSFFTASLFSWATPTFAADSNGEPLPQRLPEVVVTATTEAPLIPSQPGDSAINLLDGLPGVALQQNGALASTPSLHGLADERVKVQINGLTISSACPNHMNPALSYFSASSEAKVTVINGVTPVSLGGDSIGGTVIVEPAAPVFASGTNRLYAASLLSGFYGSNNNSYGGTVASTVATQNVSLGYVGSWSKGSDYYDGHGDKVPSTYYETTNHVVTLAAQNASNLVTLSGGITVTPNEGFVGQWMDLIDNKGGFVNADWKGTFDWGTLDARAYWQTVTHKMDIGKDKQTYPNPMYMPMNTKATNTGYVIKSEIPFFESSTLRLGNEFHRFELDDRWPAVPGNTMMMGPNTFVSINHGERNRFGLYGEWETQWDKAWKTLLGVRPEAVWMDTGNVHGYSGMYAADAAIFNSKDHEKTDFNLDATAEATYEPDKNSTYTLGFARKTRSPSLYERYAWSKVKMASMMINWFNDGNYYTGDLDLKPEAAHTVSATADWHDAEKKDWSVGVTPYYSYVQDYIDVDRYGIVKKAGNTLDQLRFANHDAFLYGVDLTLKKRLWENPTFGRGEITGVAGWLHGERVDTGGSLYHVMPLNARFSLNETLGNWSSGVELQLVDAKNDVDELRSEPTTPGYALVNLRTGYQWRNIRLDVGVNNLFDQFYYLPLGGVNFDNYLASGKTEIIQSLAGMGRTVYVSVTVRF